MIYPTSDGAKATKYAVLDAGYAILKNAIGFGPGEKQLKSFLGGMLVTVKAERKPYGLYRGVVTLQPSDRRHPDADQSESRVFYARVKPVAMTKADGREVVRQIAG